MNSPIATTAGPLGAGRKRQARSDATRTALLDAALEEFAAHGFEGASTRAIATRAGTHQPQINYHFESKEALWRAAVDHLFARLDDRLDEHLPDDVDGLPSREVFCAYVRAVVRAVAGLPELNRIIVQEATIGSDRLDWIVDAHTRSRYDLLVALWRDLRATGDAHDIDETIFYYSLIGASSLAYVNAPEARLLGQDTLSARFVEAHADALITMFLRPEGVPT